MLSELLLPDVLGGGSVTGPGSFLFQTGPLSLVELLHYCTLIGPELPWRQQSYAIKNQVVANMIIKIIIIPSNRGICLLIAFFFMA